MPELGELTAKIREANRGRTAARYLKALAAAKQFNSRPEDFVTAQRWADRDAILATLKAAIGSVGTESTGFAPTPAAAEFFSYTRPRTILGKLEGMRRAPARTRLLGADGGATAYFVGERQIRPISVQSSTGSVLEALSVAAISVQTKELVLSSDPSSDIFIRDDLSKAVIQAMDSAFADPSNAGTPSVKPASIFSGATAITSNGGRDVSSIDTDLRAAIEEISPSSDLEFATWIMSVKSATFLASLRGSGGAMAHPLMTARGGTLLGLPCVTSTAVPAYDSPSASVIGLLDASAVLFVDDGAGSFEISDQAAISMTDTSESPEATQLVSLWQVESVALKAIAHLNWQLARSGAAAYIQNVNF